MLLAESLLGSSSTAPVYIEDVFSTYLYTGNSTSGGTQTITNNVDLSTKGGMVWIKGRSAAANNMLTDTVRGAGTAPQSNNALSSDLQDGESLQTSGLDYDYLSAFSTTGFTVKQGGTTTATQGTNYNAVTYASWTFRKQPKFFDIVTYTGTGSARTISHSLGSVPGAIFVKARNEAGNWTVYHRSVGNASALFLNTTDASAASTAFNSTTPTSSVFSIGANNTVNRNGTTYVAYLFAHDAGGFGATGSDNVISCGSFTADGSGNATVTLGWEPQWFLVKETGDVGNWILIDNMRGWVNEPSSAAGRDRVLYANTNVAEITTADYGAPTATGVSIINLGGGDSYIYIAIRRGPMKTPTLGTSVLRFDSIVGGSLWTEISTNGRLGNSVNGLDAVFTKSRAAADNWTLTPRLTGFSPTFAVAASLSTNLTDAESVKTGGVRGGAAASSTNLQAAAIATGSAISYSLGRAPGFFDVVCYTGTGVSGVTVNHNLGTSPQLVITKVRNFTGEDWVVHYNSGSSIVGGYLNNTTAFANSSTAPSTDIRNLTSTTYTLNTSNRRVNGVYNYVAYLFATVAGVSKVFSYTGNGSSQTINCGFTGGARFVLIKRTDSTGNWTVFDSARGIVAGNDPALYLNSTAAEVTTIDAVDTDSSGFIVNQDATLNLNVNSASYIGLAIA